jgi:hypothetical protein
MTRPRLATPTTLVGLYLTLLLALAALGAHNQALGRHEATLHTDLAAARLATVDARADAAAVEGPLAVARWAQTRGMVPAPDVETVRHVQPLPAPPTPPAPDPTPTLEVTTTWR